MELFLGIMAEVNMKKWMIPPPEHFKQRLWTLLIVWDEF